MKKFYPSVSETASVDSDCHEPMQPRRSTIEFIRNFARACQSVGNGSVRPEFSAVVLN